MVEWMNKIAHRSTFLKCFELNWQYIKNKKRNDFLNYILKLKVGIKKGWMNVVHIALGTSLLSPPLTYDNAFQLETPIFLNYIVD